MLDLKIYIQRENICDLFYWWIYPEVSWTIAEIQYQFSLNRINLLSQMGHGLFQGQLISPLVLCISMAELGLHWLR